RVDDGGIKRMSHGSDHFGRGAARKLRIGIERNDEADVLNLRKVAHFYWEWIESVPQQLVEIEQLAALALPTHPRALLRIVNTMAVEEIKMAEIQTTVTLVQVVNQLPGKLNSRIVVVGGFRAVGKIGKQCVMYVAVLIAKIANFKIFYELANLLFVDEQRWNGDKGLAIIRNAIGEIEFWKRLRLQDGGDEVIHQLNGSLCNR